MNIGKLAKLATALAASLTLLTTAAHAQVKVGVISSAVGATAFVGIPQRNSVALLPTEVDGTKIEYIFYDDGSDPTHSVQLAQKLITEHKIDALIGPSGSPNAMGVLGFLAEAGTPMLAPVGTAAVVLPMDDKKRWVFKTHPNDGVIAGRLLEAMSARGVKTVGFIGFNDPYGENWYKTFAEMAEKVGIRMVADERYGRQDTSVTGQVVKLMGANPDAVLVGGIAAAAALPHRQLIEVGYKGDIYHTHGSASGAFIQIGRDAVEGALIVGPLLLVLDEVDEAHPVRQVAHEYVSRYEQMHGSRPPIFGAGVYDAGLLLQAALPKALAQAKPGTGEFRAALRNELEKVQGLVASQGVINMSADDHSGFDDGGQVLMTVKDGRFTLVHD